MEKTLKLYTYVDGINDTPFPSIDDQIEVGSFTYNAKRMGGAPNITFTVKNRLCLDDVWTDKVYTIFNEEKYYLKQIPTSSYDNSDSRYRHEVEMVSERIILENVYFFDVVADDTDNDKPVSNSSNVVFFGDIHEFASRLQRSLSYSHLDYTVIVDDDVESDAKLMSFNDQFFANVLQEIYKIFEIPYYFVGKEIHIGHDEYEVEEVFEYGVNNSLLSISKENANYKIVNRCTGDGSGDNIPYYYPNHSPYGKLNTLYNGAISQKINITDWSKFSSYGPSSKLTYTEEIQNQGYEQIASLDDFETVEVKFSGYLLDQPQYRWVAKCPIKIDTPKATVYIYCGFTESVALDIGCSIVDDNGVTIAQSAFGIFAAVELGYGSYDVYVNIGVGNRPDPESYVRDAAFVKVEAAFSSSYQGWRLNDKGIIDLSTMGITFTGIASKGDTISFEIAEGRVPIVGKLMPSIYRESYGAERFYNALNDTYIIPGTNGDKYKFSNPYFTGEPREHIVHFEDIKPSIKEMTNAAGQRIDMFVDFAYDLNDNDEIDENGKYEHPYFYAKLRKFNGENGFNLFAHAIEGNPMTIAMTSGTCGACQWTIGVDDKSNRNVVQVYEVDTTDADGVFHAAGSLKRNDNGDVLRSGVAQDIQNDTRTNEVWVALKKEESTFGVLMPNANHNYRPSVNDTFVILHISLPEAYIYAAERRLTEAIIKYMSENNDDKFNFSIKFSRIFLEQNQDILESLNENSLINVKYNERVYSLHVSSYSYKMSNNLPLPEVIVELSDTITINRSALQNTINEIKSADGRATVVSESGASGLRTNANLALNGKSAIMVSEAIVTDLGLRHFVRKKGADTIYDEKTFEDDIFFRKNVQSDDFSRGGMTGSGWGIYKDEQGRTVAEIDKLIARQKLEINDLKINQSTYQKGVQALTNGGCVIESVEEYDTYYRCYFNNEQGTFFSGFVVGDQARCQRFDETFNGVTKYYWRLVVSVSASYVDLSKEDYSGDGIPTSGDTIVQLGHRTNADRQNAILISSYPRPTITQYIGINSYTLPEPSTVISPDNNLFTGKAVFEAGSSGLENLEEWASKQQQINNANANASQALNDLNNFKSNYNSTITRIENQLDKKADTWYQASDPSQNWVSADEKQEHIGDLWYDTTAEQSFMWDGSTWVTQGVPDEVFDTIDGKSSIFVLKPEAYRANDIWVLENDYVLSESYVKGTWVVALQTSDTFVPSHWKKLDTYADKEYISKLETGSTNLLRNSGFTGDYISTNLKENTSLNNGSQMFSPSLQHWGTSDVIAQESEVSQSGVEAVISNGVMAQTLKVPLLKGEKYIFSFRGKGEYISYEIGGNTNTITLNGMWNKYVERFVATSDSTIFTISGNATLCELQLTHGDIVAAWSPSVWDNSSELAYYQTLQYLSDAIKNGSTTFQGGLVLSNILLMGNVNDDVLEKNTAGVSGVYSDDTDVAFWAGGTMEQAIHLVQLMTENPNYQPTDAEWETLAKFAATHGGDVFMKGYIYAMGGLFKGTVSIANGKILLNADGSGRLSNGALEWDKEGRLYKNFPDMIRWRSLKNTTINYSLGGYYIAESNTVKTLSLGTPPVTPYRLVLKAADVITPDNKSVTIATSDGAQFFYADPNDANTFYSGTFLTITTRNNSAKGMIEITRDGGIWDIFVPSSMTVGGVGTVSDVLIF